MDRWSRNIDFYKDYIYTYIYRKVSIDVYNFGKFLDCERDISEITAKKKVKEEEKEKEKKKKAKSWRRRTNWVCRNPSSSMNRQSTINKARPKPRTRSARAHQSPFHEIKHQSPPKHRGFELDPNQISERNGSDPKIGASFGISQPLQSLPQVLLHLNPHIIH